MIKILIGIPTYDRRLDIELTRILIYLERLNKYHLDFIFPVSSHLSRNRNMCCQEALKGQYDWLLFLDSDIGIQDETFLDKLIETAYRFDAQIVGGAYRMKKPDLNEMTYIAKNGGDNLKEIKFPRLIKAVGTGIMLINIDVLKKIPDPWFTILDKPKLEVDPEDYNFCKKAIDLSFKIAIDPRFETNHYGFYNWKHF